MDTDARVKLMVALGVTSAIGIGLRGGQQNAGWDLRRELAGLKKERKKAKNRAIVGYLDQAIARAEARIAEQDALDAAYAADPHRYDSYEGEVLSRRPLPDWQGLPDEPDAHMAKFARWEDEYTYAGEGNRRGRRARGRRAATMTAAAARKYLLKQGWRAKDIDNPKPSSALGEPLPERYRAMAIESSLPAYQVSKRSQAKTARAWRALAAAAAKGRFTRSLPDYAHFTVTEYRGKGKPVRWDEWGYLPRFIERADWEIERGDAERVVVARKLPGGSGAKEVYSRSAKKGRSARGRRSRIPTGTIHTGRFNDLGNELVVFPGRSDWGEQGWFVGEQVNHPGREPFVTPKVFFRGAEGKDHALDSARTEEFWGYPEGRSARGRRAKAPGRLWKTVAGVRVYKTPDGEYIVAPDLDYPHGWYYTDDPQDAGGTAMIEGRRRGWGKGRRAAQVPAPWSSSKKYGRVVKTVREEPRFKFGKRTGGDHVCVIYKKDGVYSIHYYEKGKLIERRGGFTLKDMQDWSDKGEPYRWGYDKLTYPVKSGQIVAKGRSAKGRAAQGRRRGWGKGR